MNSRLFIIISALLFASQAAALEIEVRAYVTHETPLWVGQRLELNVELRTNGARFGQQRVRLPDVPGALILEDSMLSTTTNEQIDGIAWQVQRLQYPMFVQRGGAVEVAEIVTEFGVYETFTSDPMPVTRKTRPFSFAAVLPSGVKDARKLITTDRMSLEVELSPDKESFIVGDALTQTITREANDVSGMAFAPLQTPNISGIAAYPKVPDITDKEYRGTLTSTRVDTTTLVFEQAGEFEIPAIDLEWWNPQSERLHTERVPPLLVLVEKNPAVVAAAAAAEAEVVTRARRTAFLKVLAAAVVLGFVVTLFLRRFWPGMLATLRQRREIRRESEPARFAELERACAENKAAAAYNAFNRWREHWAESELENNKALQEELLRVQRAILDCDASWQGRALGVALKEARKRAGSRTTADTRSAVLPALNPSARNVLRS